MRGLYAIVDHGSLGALGVDVLAFARAVLAAGPAAVQLRAKALGAGQTLALLRALSPLCRDAGALLFANDRPDLALLAGCDGVHVGQTDLAVADVRAAFPGLKVGVSTHDARELEAALASRPDYLAFGPVFPTGSKENPDPVVGVDGLARARAKAGAVPLVAIGGIDLERAPLVAEHADMGAVIGALLPRAGELLDAVTARARELHARLGGAA